MIYLVIAFSTLLFTIFITPYFIQYLNKIRIVDTPGDKRRIHSYPVPNLGGMIVYIITMVSISVFFRDKNNGKSLDRHDHFRISICFNKLRQTENQEKTNENDQVIIMHLVANSPGNGKFDFGYHPQSGTG